ncbi:MAG: hypothetical protein ACREAC_24375, partial [Blastocatellia bacterium]
EPVVVVGMPSSSRLDDGAPEGEAMSIWLEEKIKDAVLALRWKKCGEGLSSSYFIDAPPDSLQFRSSTASFLAHFVADRVAAEDKQQNDPGEQELDKYSLEVLASYLEEHGYIVTSTL